MATPTLQINLSFFSILKLNINKHDHYSYCMEKEVKSLKTMIIFMIPEYDRKYLKELHNIIYIQPSLFSCYT
jgi:hypothetical protein